MTAHIFFRPQSEHQRFVDEFMESTKRFHPELRIAKVDMNTRQGAALATLYDIVRFPAILVINHDGSIVELWQSDQLPTINEVAARVFSASK